MSQIKITNTTTPEITIQPAPAAKPLTQTVAEQKAMTKTLLDETMAVSKAALDTVSPVTGK